VPTLSLASCEVAYEVAGDGDTLVLVHGLGGNLHIWDDLAAALHDDFRVIRYDLRGSGKTRESEPAELTLVRWAGDLRELLDGLGIHRPILVGHSLGAGISLKYALRWPDGIRALVLMGADPALSRLGPRLQKTVGLLSDVGMQTWVDEYWSKNPPFSAESLARTPALYDRYRAMVLRNSAESYIRTCLAIANCEDLSESLNSVTVPALVIVGGKDDRTLPEEGRRLAEQLPDSQLHEIGDAGHSLPVEAPGEIAEAIKQFVAGLDGRQA
jgi:pimeloyl-ACP methyl ester carboxylesterase